MASRKRKAQRLQLEPLIDLYEIDLHKQGGGLLRWTPGPLGGLSKNLIKNPCMIVKQEPWTSAGTSHFGIGSLNGAGWGLPVWGNGYMRQSGGLTGGAYMAAYPEDTASGRYKAKPGQWWCWQVRVMTVRCKARAEISWHDSSGYVISRSTSSYQSAISPSPDNASDLNAYKMVSVIARAPASTVTAMPAIVSDENGTVTNPMVFFTQAMATVHSSQIRKAPVWSQSYGSGKVRFDGVSYDPVPIEIQGSAMRGSGQLPRPRVTAPDSDDPTLGITALMDLYGDLLGCKVTRKRVFRSALDDQPEADNSDFFGPEVWYIDRVAEHIPGSHATFELVAGLDLQGMTLPRRQVIGQTCTATYRWWDGSKFVAGFCPYTGGSLFKADGTATGVASEDICGRRLSDCRLRFGNGTLPFWGFPGILRVRD